MSSDESDNNASESEQEEEEEKPVTTSKPAPARSTESKVNIKAPGLDDGERELLEYNKNERDKMENEIEELRRRSEKRKKQREEEEKRLAAERVAEDEKRKSNEEARKRQKIEDAERKQKERALKLAEFEKWKTPQKRNFVITRKESGEEEVEDTGEEDDKGRKSKEQQEAEKKATLKQRIKPLDTSDLDQAKLAEKAKEIHSWLSRLESEKYDLEKWLKSQQATLQDLAEKARQANKVGKGGLKRVGEDQIDKIQAKYTGAPAKVEMFSKYERQKDNRTYQEMYEMFVGPQYISPPERILPKRTIDWDEERMPVYSGSAAPVEAEHVPEAAAAN